MHVGILAEASIASLTAWLDSAPANHERGGTFAQIELEQIRRVLTRLPSPPAPLTVAGTKGKGSTVRFAEAILVAHGEPTLAFTSPHVASVLERWRIDGQPISAETAVRAARVVAEAERAITLTWFEKTFALAVVLASERPGTRFLCEVGLGGRLDCANALDCAVAVLTHLSHDHRDVLGPTLWHIAGEKLAVARAGRPLIIAPQSAEAQAAIHERLPDGVPVTWIAAPAREIPLAMPGSHQQGNAATALAAVTALRGAIDPDRAGSALGGATLAARCQRIVRGDQRLLIDGAHNGPSIAATIAVARQQLRPGWRLILGLAGDKEIAEILAVIPPDLAVLRCGYHSTRARLESAWPAPARRWPWHDHVASALAAGAGTDLCLTGSFYLAAEALDALGAAGSLPG